jgi:ABC-type sugar transport system ATPase subunit
VAAIRLRDVTKVYSRSSYQGHPNVRSISQVDRAFVERAAAQAASESAARSSHQGDIVALDRVSLIVPDGEALAVVGPSGCGKSTLLGVVAGLTDYNGEVFYDDQPMEDVPPRERYIGMVFQNYALYPHFEGRGNLAFFFKMHKAPDAETEERIRVTSETMGIGFRELLGRKPGVLSGGEQQRLAVARALVRRPRLLLLDEPLSNLDARLRVQTRVEIKRLLRRFGITTIYVTHDQSEAATLGDRIAVMRAGRIEQLGTYQALRQDPANAFVAGFIGQPPMNLFPGGIVQGDAVSWNQIAILLPEGIRRQVQSGDSLTVGIRPEAARLANDARLRATVEAVEPDFARHTLIAYVRAGEFAFAASGQLEALPEVGEEVGIALPASDLYFFAGNTGKRIRG